MCSMWAEAFQRLIPADEAAMLEQYFAAIYLRTTQPRSAPGCVLLCEPGRSLVRLQAV